MRSWRFSLSVLLALAPGSAWAQQASRTEPVTALRDNPPGVHAFTGARIVVAPGRVLENATLVVRNGVVEAVGTNVTVDNVYAGGIAAAVDLQTGQLNQATQAGFDARRGWIDCHPDTGAPITSRVLPMWEEVCELARRAHSAFSDWVVVGWDIAILADGPSLVEGNNGPNVELIQRPLRTAFADSRFGELLAFHLNQTESVWRHSGAHSVARVVAPAESPGKVWQTGVACSSASPPID